MLLVSALMLFTIGVAAAQPRHTVTGKVTDASGAPMVGVTVIEQGTTNGTTTGVDGSYSLTVKGEKGVLTFSSLGYTSQNIPVGGKATVDVKLDEDAINMSEVVVTGYGRTVTKDKLTAAISKVSGDILERGVRSNPLQALAGTVTGVRVATTSGQPGAAPSIVIRGGAALDGTGTPLYVIDGVQKEDMNDINSNDIESIEILKDAAATALYGAKANAGVVLVTTKRGRAGKAEISFKANVGLNYLRKTNEFLAADDYLYYLRLAAYRSGNVAALSAAGPYGTGNLYEADGNKAQEGVYSTMFLTDDNAFLLKKGYKQMIDPITGKTIIYSEFTPSDASVRDMALTQDYNISASGGNDRGRYYASLGYYDESGFPVISYYKRLSFTTNASYKITPWLESNSQFNFSRSDSRQVSDYIGGGESNFFGIMFSAPPTMRRFNPDGDPVVCSTNWENGNWDAAQSSFYRRNTNYRFTMNQGLKFNITDHISLKVNGMWYFNMYEKEKFNRTYIVKPGSPNSDHAASASYSRMLSQTYNAIAGYENSWNDHNLSVIVGYEFYDKFNFGLSAGGQGADSDDFISLGYIDKTLDKNISKISMNSTHLNERSMSVFGNASYDYKGKYLFEASMRADGTSRFAKKDRWGYFPSVSAGWRFTEERFMEGVRHWWDNGKIRLSYGALGNQQVSNYLYLQTIGTGTLNYLFDDSGKASYASVSDPMSSNLTWETVYTYNLGLDLSFLQNRLSFTGDFFIRDTKDMLTQSLTLPSVYGAATPTENCADLRTKGWELSITWRDQFKLGGKPFHYALTGQIGDYQTEITKYNNPTKLFDSYYEGKKLGEIWGYHVPKLFDTDEEAAAYQVAINNSSNVYQRVYNMQNNLGRLMAGDVMFEDRDGSGSIGTGAGTVDDPGDMMIIGNTTPRYSYSFRIEASWNGFDISAFFQGVGKRDWYPTANKDDIYGANQFWQLYGYTIPSFITYDFMDDVWSEQNPGGYFPRLRPIQSYNGGPLGQNNDRYLQSVAYLRFKNLTIGYTLPVLKKYLSKLRIYVSGENLCYWSPLKKHCKLIDPELAISSGTYKGGTGTGYTMPRTFSFGVDITF